MLNEMMHRPVVMKELVTYMREKQQKFPGALGELEAIANKRGVPIIPHETAKFLDFFTATIQPKEILEIGTAIGFSASLMAAHLSTDGHLTTIDRYAMMYDEAKVNFDNMGLTDRISLIEGDAADVLPTLEANHYDLIFMDCGKSKYIEFYPECLRLLKVGGVLVVDDVFQGGTILEPIENRPRRVRTIHRKLNLFLDTVLEDTTHRSCLVPLGDGILMVRKEA